ncbi:tetratricopeptide repeat protein [Novosphingobium sp.]|uniref:tetratricopeptide repeat protein n=1 Tax=Novosphingobium sp. TaxID=1874826 RepID=UPI002626B47F|nr:tetratricopeptide repeat protein [Novosphingobium sp.]
MFSRLSPLLLLSLILLGGCEAAAPAVDPAQADRALAEHRFHDAKSQLLAIREAAGPSAETARKLALVTLELGDGYAAEYHLGEWRSISGESSDWIAMRAHSLILEGSPRSARELITQFNGTRPLPARHEWLLVWTAMEEGNLKKAQERVSAALARYPRSADLHARAGRLMAMQGDWGAADEHVAAALQADPHHFEALLLQGESRIAKGDLAGALEPYQIAVKTYPDFAVPYANSAGLLLDLGRLDEAQTSLATALARHPNFPLLRFSAARLDALRGRWAEARAALQAMPMDFKRGFPSATLLEAEAEAALGNHAMARSLIDSLSSKPGMRDQVAELLKRLPAAS